jgi:hypothetical protein
LGAVASFLALAIAGLASTDPQVVRAAYLAMPLIGWLVIVPASLGALVTGLVQALGTPWGLFRHYWVLVKFLLTIGGIVVLLLHMRVVDQLSRAATASALAPADLRGLRLQIAADAGAALVVLLVTTALAVYKPRGVTPFGRRRASLARRQPTASRARSEIEGGGEHANG